MKSIEEINRAELISGAQECYDEELKHRGMAPGSEASELSSGTAAEPDWLKDGLCACSFDGIPGTNPTPQLEEARAILESAGIPCYATAKKVEEPYGPQPRYDYELMVPGGYHLKAISVLDKEFFNPELEAEWRNHFATLSDEDFRSLNLSDLTAGLLDRVERLTSAYKEELANRGLSETVH